MAATIEETFQRPVGELLRGWRERRRLSQLELANRVEVSTRHVSFVETGRSRPSREMVLRLAEHLDVPLRDRNQLLLAGGFAPIYSEASLHSPAMLAIRTTLRRLLKAHEPYPALVVDRWWNIVETNAGIQLFTAGVDEKLLQAPINALRLTLHPDGLARRIGNIADVRAAALGQPATPGREHRRPRAPGSVRRTPPVRRGRPAGASGAGRGRRTVQTACTTATNCRC